MIDHPLNVVAWETEWVCATWHDVLLVVWRDEVTALLARRCADAMRAFAAARPGGFCMLVVAEDSTGPPGAKARSIFVSAMRENGTRIRATAYVISIEGFKGAALRGVITGLSLLARKPYPTRIFSEASAAARWLGAHLATGMNAISLGQQIEDVARQLRTR
jgi:hypothetical protein